MSDPTKAETQSVELTIDGRTTRAPQGATVLEAARAAGVYIPALCAGPEVGEPRPATQPRSGAEAQPQQPRPGAEDSARRLLEPFGACRLCLVEIDGMRGLPASCATTVSDGMVVRTDTERVNEVRRVICELLISDHPQDCLTCIANGRCELQDAAAYLGIRERRMPVLEREAVFDESDPFYFRDLERCILCGLCVRACDEIRGVGAIEVAGRGFDSRIAAFGDRPVRESTCESCGECVDLCPVGALWTKAERVPATAWTRTVCVYCGCGCEIDLGTRNNRIAEIRGERRSPVNAGSLCVKGRFGLDFVSSPERLTRPLVRRNGELVETDWDEALDTVAARLRETVEQHDADAVGGLSSAKCTNEENYLFQKFMRAVIGTNNVDHCARLCHASTVAGLARAFGSGAMTNSMAELRGADCILVTGSNTTEAHPIAALEIIKAVRENDAELIVADPRAIPLTRYASQHIRQRSGTDVALFNAMMHVILNEGLADTAFIEERTENFEEFRDSLARCTPEWAALITGVSAADIRRAARAYGTAERASIVYSMGITQHTTGTDNVLALANLAMLTGNVGRESTGINPLRGQNNVQGACDMGALPDTLPGYQKVTDESVLDKFAADWGVRPPAGRGLTVVEMMNAASDGDLRALYIMGENPVISDPNVNHVREALQEIDFLVVQDIFLSDTAELADVVLPAVSFAEKTGTFTNTERRVQLLRRALEPPGEAREDARILCDLADRLGRSIGSGEAARTLDEIARLTPLYGGMAVDRLENGGLQWPCRDRDDPGTPYLHKGRFTRGLGRFHAVEFREADERPDEEYRYILTTGRLLYHFHSGTLTRRSPGLEEISPPTPVEIHPEDARAEGIADGELVAITSRRGTIRARAVVTERIPAGQVFIPFHFREAPANALTNDALDPVAKIPEFKVCAVKLGHGAEDLPAGTSAAAAAER
ncbi:MAG: formate dehydrogenase subunit alpha [Spirochaetaceae bacterium]